MRISGLNRGIVPHIRKYPDGTGKQRNTYENARTEPGNSAAHMRMPGLNRATVLSIYAGPNRKTVLHGSV